MIISRCDCKKSNNYSYNDCNRLNDKCNYKIEIEMYQRKVGKLMEYETKKHGEGRL